MDEKRYLKILKKQKNDLEDIDKENIKILNNLNDNFENSEKLLLELGYSLPKKNIEKQLENKIKMDLRTWDNIKVEASTMFNEDVSFEDLLTDTEIKRIYSKIECLRDDYEDLTKVNCDKYDYLIASGCGVITGLIDVLFVGAPGEGALSKLMDGKTEEVVKKLAKLSGWNEKKAEEKGTNTLKSAIGYLERKFGINYDQQTGQAVNGLFKMSTKNHHLKSLAHSPSPIGLVFAIINQFNNTSTFISNGKLITIDTDKFELKGSDFLSKIYCAFVNWIMHIVSDMAGSSGAKGRGSGVPIPFYELFQFLNFGKIGKHQKTFADISVLVFESGYDLRHGMAMSIPVILNEMLVRFLWAIKLYFSENKNIKEILALNKSRELKRILFTAHGCFCLVDLGDAFIKNVGNPEPVTKIVGMLTHMNVVAWTRFSKLGIEELKILVCKENEKHKYVNEKLNQEWLKLASDVNKSYNSIISY